MEEEEGSKKCPYAWSLTTTDDLRTHLSIFDIIPSAVDGHRGNESAMFLNHDLLGMFRAMAAHKSQFRWCASYLFESIRISITIKLSVVNDANPLQRGNLSDKTPNPCEAFRV